MEPRESIRQRNPIRSERPVSRLNRTSLALGLALACPAIGLAQSPPATQDGAAGSIDHGLLTRAERDLEQGKLELAAERFRRIVEQGGSDRRVHLGLGRTLHAMGDHAGAVTSLVEASRFRERDYDVTLLLAEALLGQARVALADGDQMGAEYSLRDARRYFDTAAGYRPIEAAPILGASRVERTRGDESTALNLAIQACELDPEHVESFLELGSLRFAVYWSILGRQGAEAARDARELCRRAYAHVLDLQPSNAFAMNGLAWIAMQAGEKEAAAEWFHKSLLADPTLTDSYENLRDLLSGSMEERRRFVQLLGPVVNRTRTWRSGTERKRARALAHFRRGLAHLEVREAAGLKRDLSEAARFDPELAVRCNVLLAVGLFRDGQRDEAAGAIADLVAKDQLDGVLEAIQQSEDPRKVGLMIRGLADIQFKAKKLEPARDLYRVAAEVLDDSADDWNNCAFLYRETGRFEESFEAYQRALVLEEDNPSILNDTALILHYHLHHDLDLARELYGRAIEAAKGVLEDPAADSFARAAATQAAKDANRNLKNLDAGILSEADQRAARRRKPDKNRKPQKDPEIR